MSRAPAGVVTVEVVVRGATLTALLMLVVSLHAATADVAAAADGPQGPPTLQPSRVEHPTEAFSLVPPTDARCEDDGAGRSGADGWRWHTFIVEAGRELSSLEFDGSGPGPGLDFDATDGQITAPLIEGGRMIWAEPPAEQPRGLINPGDLGGLVLDPSDYTLVDGSYLIGFVCTDEASATRQWWSLEVTVQTAAAPFLTATTADAITTTVSTATSTPEGAAADGSTTTTAAATAGEPTAAAGAPAPVPPPTAEGDAEPRGISWTPLVGLTSASSVLPVGAWAVLVLVLARIAYLLARPVRVLPSILP